MKKYLILVLVITSFSVACSRIDIAYKWADVFVAGKVDDYFDVSSKQKKELKRSFNEDLKETTKGMLPAVVGYLDGIKKEVNESHMDAERVAFYFSAIMADFRKVKASFARTAVRFIATTSPDQIQHFQKAYYKKIGEDFAKASDSRKLYEDYLEKYQDYFEMFLGSLTKEQEEMIKSHLLASPFPAKLKAKNSEHLMAEFLKEAGSLSERQTFVKKLYENPELLDLPDYRKAVSHYQSDLQKLIVGVVGSLTPQQKERFKKSIDEKKSQLLSLGV